MKASANGHLGEPFENHLDPGRRPMEAVLAVSEWVHDQLTCGWWGFDPANDIEIGRRHVWVANRA